MKRRYQVDIFFLGIILSSYPLVGNFFESLYQKDLEHPDLETLNSSQVSRLRQESPLTKERTDSNSKRNVPLNRQTETVQEPDNHTRFSHDAGGRLVTNEELEPKIGLFGFKNEKYFWAE